MSESRPSRFFTKLLKKHSIRKPLILFLLFSMNILVKKLRCNILLIYYAFSFSFIKVNLFALWADIQGKLRPRCQRALTCINKVFRGLIVDSIWTGDIKDFLLARTNAAYNSWGIPQRWTNLILFLQITLDDLKPLYSWLKTREKHVTFYRSISKLKDESTSKQVISHISLRDRIHTHKHITHKWKSDIPKTVILRGVNPFAEPSSFICWTLCRKPNSNNVNTTIYLQKTGGELSV